MSRLTVALLSVLTLLFASACSLEGADRSSSSGDSDPNIGREGGHRGDGSDDSDDNGDGTNPEIDPDIIGGTLGAPGAPRGSRHIQSGSPAQVLPSTYGFSFGALP